MHKITAWFKWQQLHIRAALIALLLFTVLCIAMLTMLHRYSQQLSLESAQRMNLGLAKYVVDHQPNELIGIAGKPDRGLMKDIAQHVMMINPAVEVYLLDTQGRVVAHALEGAQDKAPLSGQVNLDQIHALLNAGDTTSAALQLPILGDDPRRPGQKNIVSVSPINAGGVNQGYLYIVLQSQALQALTSNLQSSHAIKELALGTLLATLIAVIVMMIALRKLTLPLRNLTLQMRAFRSDALGIPDQPSEDEIKVLSSAISAMQTRITQQFKRLEESDQHRRELISNISHDLRTPLSNIQGYVETVLVRGEQLDAQGRAQHLRTALKHITLLGKRVGDLFELSKLDAGQVQPKHEVFCLAELLQDIVQNYQLAAQGRHVKLSLAAGSYTKTRVYADIALIERVLQNLIDNALRYTPSGGEVSLQLNARDANIEVSVVDTGQGIAREHLPHIFERYWHASGHAGGHVIGHVIGHVSAHTSGHMIEDENVQAAQSSGLGLAIVKKILDLHGSVARVHSELKRGTSIQFELPMHA
jgi:two-component system, OmpR family, sensor kinase